MDENRPKDEASPVRAERKRPGRRARNRVCQLCKKEYLFCWTCRCGFAMCQPCMDENFWTLSCNGIQWQCPECSQLNGYGNQ